MKSALTPTLLSVTGFTFVTLAAYACWAFGGNFLGSPVVLYLACTIVFLVLGSFSLYPLAAESTSKKRFFATYTIGFLGYAICWCVFWMLLHNKTGEWIGSLVGLLVMTFAFRLGIKRPQKLLLPFFLLFLFHSIGYFAGEQIHLALRHSHTTLARLGWGFAHGLGFAIGLTALLNSSGNPQPNPVSASAETPQ